MVVENVMGNGLRMFNAAKEQFYRNIRFVHKILVQIRQQLQCIPQRKGFKGRSKELQKC